MAHHFSERRSIMATWARFAENGYECSSQGDRRFSALFARLKDGRTIEEAYQLDIKGYRKLGNNWRLGKGKPPLDKSINLWKEYAKLWIQWARENKTLMEELKTVTDTGKTLTDMFATSNISQARALAEIINHWEWVYHE